LLSIVFIIIFFFIFLRFFLLISKSFSSFYFYVFFFFYYLFHKWSNFLFFQTYDFLIFPIFIVLAINFAKWLEQKMLFLLILQLCLKSSLLRLLILSRNSWFLLSFYICYVHIQFLGVSFYLHFKGR
jgi:hypothetical protein